MFDHPDKIYPGHVLRIPHVELGTHTVFRGDTLGKIASHFYGKSSLYTLVFEAHRDSLSSPDAIEVGQTLKIPLRTTSSAQRTK